MLSIKEVSADLSLIKPYIDQQLAAALVKEYGYNWPEERVLRIAKDAARLMTKGAPADWAFDEAFFSELALYGDGKPIQFTGFVNTK